MSDSRAEELLELAAAERRRLRRHLLVAAAFREMLAREPVVVGGTAEEYWTAGEYHETDLDLCVPLDGPAREALEAHGFRREGRHWVRDDVLVAVEIPDARIDGDESRTVLEPVGPGHARIIGVEDLYLDRVRQATVAEGRDDIHFESVLSVAVSCFERLDWRYVKARIAETGRTDRPLGEAMSRVDERARRRARRVLSEPSDRRQEGDG